MVLLRHRLLLLSFSLLVAAWAVFSVASGADTGLLYLAPALVLCTPLIAGRYVGEKQLAQLAGRSRSRPCRRPARLAVPRSHMRLMQRGGRLVASSLAKRPPPMVATLLAA
jgi:hypothetical protein